MSITVDCRKTFSFSFLFEHVVGNLLYSLSLGEGEQALKHCTVGMWWAWFKWRIERHLLNMREAITHQSWLAVSFKPEKEDLQKKSIHLVHVYVVCLIVIELCDEKEQKKEQNQIFHVCFSQLLYGLASKPIGALFYNSIARLLVCRCLVWISYSCHKAAPIPYVQAAIMIFSHSSLNYRGYRNFTAHSH